MIVIATRMVVGHVVAAAEPFAKISAFIAGQIRVTELVVAVRIGRPMGVDVVARGFNAIVETAVPCMRPAALRLHWLPASWSFLGMNGEHSSTG